MKTLRGAKEILGLVLPPDPLTVTMFYPADESTNVSIASNIVVTFSEPIARGTGFIALKNATGTVIENFDAASSTLVMLSGATLTINPSADLNFSTGYRVELAAGTLQGLGGAQFAGTTSYNFSTLPTGADFASVVDLANIAAGTGGFAIHGQDAGDQSGNSVASAGDINGDGFDDLIIGAAFGDGANNGKSNAGDSYVVFGKATGFVAAVDLEDIAAGTGGFVMHGQDAMDLSGYSVASAGDINGDGFDDLIVGAAWGDGANDGKANAGDSYVVFGKAGGFNAAIDLGSIAAGTGGFVIHGQDVSDYSGSSVASAGDINGDGFDDLIVGAVFGDAANDAKPSAGESYVVFGKASGFDASLDLSNVASGSGGFVIYGQDANDASGWSVASAGDINSDGFDDLLIGARQGDAADNAKADAGDSYVVFGKATGFGAAVDLVNIAAGTGGFVIFGQDDGDQSGRSVASAGDLNGDGFDDLIVGARYGAAANNAKSNAGDSYVIFGRDFSGTVTHQGSASADTLNGSASADAMIGGLGDDTLTGGGGADVIRGGAGEDFLTGGSGADRIDGGSGRDTADYTGSATAVTVNLATNHNSGGDAAGDLLSDIEDLRGSANNDVLTGNALANRLAGVDGNDTLTGGAGADTLEGGTGLDMATFAGNRAAYTIIRDQQNGSFIVAALSGNDGTDRVKDIELLRFADSTTVLALLTSDTGIVDNFNPYHYLASNPGLIGVFGADTNAALDHYYRFGFDEGRPIGSFNAYAYLASNPGLIPFYGNNINAGIEHYVRYGFGENRPTASFDGERYLASNPTLIATLGTSADAGAAHYVQSGFSLGLPTTTFNGYCYLASNIGLLNFYGPDAAAATNHYLHFGIAEGRSATVFDPYLYMASNPGLIAPLGANADLACEHYLKFGYGENRPATGFSVNQYLATNHTLIPFFSGNSAAAIEHFVKFGFAEGRPANGFFGQLYLASNPTLIDTLAHTLEGAATHYVQTGYAQGLQVEGFNPLQYLASNLGLLNVFGPDAFAAINHYIDFGHQEGRPVTTFDGLEYIASNPGLIPFFGTNADAGIAHYVYNGVAEGRPTISFNAQQYHDNYGDLEGKTLGEARTDFISGGLAQGRGDAALPLSAGATAGPDNLSGSSGADSLSGGTGADTLNGGLGNDTLTGGYGADQFVFNTTLDAATNLDRVIDFTHGVDKLLLDQAIFALPVNAGALAADNFASNATGSALDGDDFVVYNNVTGVLSYDADGNGGGAPIAFANLASHPLLTAADFTVI